MIYGFKSFVLHNIHYAVLFYIHISYSKRPYYRPYGRFVFLSPRASFSIAKALAFQAAFGAPRPCQEDRYAWCLWRNDPECPQALQCRASPRNIRGRINVSDCAEIPFPLKHLRIRISASFPSIYLSCRAASRFSL